MLYKVNKIDLCKMQKTGIKTEILLTYRKFL